MIENSGSTKQSHEGKKGMMLSWPGMTIEKVHFLHDSPQFHLNQVGGDIF